VVDQQSWKNYEDIARYFLNRFRQEFGLEHVDAKQKLKGSSGTSWEIDAKGVRDGDNGAIILVECRQHRSKRLNQEAIGGLAYRIIDTGASGAIIVSPLPLQEGARKVAEANNIIHVQLRPDSTPENFGLSFFSKILVGFTERVTFSEDVSIVIVDNDGNKTTKV
jgi:hypothetical protein